LEKKLHAAPLKEITVKRFPGGSLQKKQKALLVSFHLIYRKQQGALLV
jgi:hypothetical protein